MDAISGKVIHGTTNIFEHSFNDISKYFKELRDKGLNPYSITIDGHPCVIKAVRLIWPDIIIQRCVIHIQRQGLMWCRVKPKRIDARKLREIFVKSSDINTLEEMNEFVSQINDWELKHGEKIKSQPEKGWVFSDIKRARSMIIRALPNMFHYMRNNKIPRSTNMVEGCFSRAKKSYKNHQGLAPKKRANFFLWHMYFNSK